MGRALETFSVAWALGGMSVHLQGWHLAASHLSKHGPGENFWGGERPVGGTATYSDTHTRKK